MPRPNLKRVPDFLKPALEKPEPQATTRFTFLEITPDQAQIILDTMLFDTQPILDRAHIAALAYEMTEGTYTDSTEQIGFAFHDDGILKLIDGQHRLLAAIQANYTALWAVQVRWTLNASQAHGLIDTRRKARNKSAIARTMNLTDLTDGTTNSIIGAVTYQLLWGNDYELPEGLVIPPRQHIEEYANEMYSHFILADNIIEEVPSQIGQMRRKLRSPSVLALITETLRQAPQAAPAFWLDVATAGGAESALALQGRLLSNTPVSSRNRYEYVRLAAIAWNRRGGKMRVLKDHDITRPIRTDGVALTIPA